MSVDPRVLTREQIQKLRDDIKDRQPWYDDGEIDALCDLALRGIESEAGQKRSEYDPLKDDAQAMALVKKFRLDLNHDEAGACWASWFAEGYEGEGVGERHVSEWGANENVAICKCVAAMQVRTRQES